MDKNAIKKYAVWARNELIARVTQKAEQYEIFPAGGPDGESMTPADAESVGGRVLSDVEKKQRKALIAKIDKDGFDAVMEEAAYTWFNRFTALRFMEVNNYLLSYTRVFTNERGEFRPQILADAIRLELDGLDMERVFELKSANKDEELFKYLLITQCNALSKILPGMFQKIEDFTELLLPDFLLREGSVIEQMIALIPEEDWTDQVQIIGWLYQYYNTEPKDEVFAGLKKKQKITKEKIPAATQLFTPDWIVRYMVENSLGRLWLEGHPNEALKAEWKYYLDEAEQEPEVQAQLDEIRKEYSALQPEEIRCIDPCSGSGHILCYMFDVLVRIYEDYGYTAREAATKIIENNLWGLDIDDRAAQLSYFAVMMKARQYDRRFFRKKDENGELCIPQPHVYAIQESNNLDPHLIEYFTDGQEDLKTAMDTLVEELHDAKEYGSILNVTPVGFDALYARFDEIRNKAVPGIYSRQALDVLLPFVQSAQALAQKYHAVVTNPPYMGNSGMSTTISTYVKKHFPDSRSDLFAVFVEKCCLMTIQNGFQAMITQQAFMFLLSFNTLRRKILSTTPICSMLHLGFGAFGTDFGTTTFVLRKSVFNYRGTYLGVKESRSIDEKEKLARKRICNSDLFYKSVSQFLQLPNTPIAYWVSDRFMITFAENPRVSEVSEVTRGLTTGNNDKFLRLWHEISFLDLFLNCASMSECMLSRKKWFAYNKGGDYRTWYGNNDLVVYFYNGGEDLKEYYKENKAVRFTGIEYYFLEGITWTALSAGTNSFRYSNNHIFDSNKGPMLFTEKKRMHYILGLLNSKVSKYIIQMINPTISLQNADIKNIPYIEAVSRYDRVVELVKKNITFSKEDWDSFEFSWDFQWHPFIDVKNCFVYSQSIVKCVGECYQEWESQCEERFIQLKQNEEELNRIFIDIYGLQDELTPEVEDKDVTVRKADLQRDVRSFISYAVGCMFGRYSLDEPGLAYAGGDWDPGKYTTFQPDSDAIIPICDDEYFQDDIVGRFVDFVEVVYGKEALEENLRFVADALGGKGSSREVIRNYFISDFYKDHCKVYQKRPIYWLFDSGRKNGFKCLVYIHRYAPDTVARIRTDYVHEQQSRYRTTIADLENRISAASSSDKVKLKKQLTRVQAQAEEIRAYEEKIHHFADQMISIDLDDGVKHNYAIFKDVLAKIK